MWIYVQSALLVLVPLLLIVAIAIAMARRLKTQLTVLPTVEPRASGPTKGTQVGDYVLDDPLGEGGTAVVYRGRGPNGVECAVKLLKVGELPDPEEFRKRMGREVRILQKLEHPGVVRILDWGHSNYGPYLVEELVTGAALAAAIPLSQTDFMRVFRQLLEAVSHAHSHGIVHRDLKPDNILLPDGAVKVTDFGLARSDFMTMLTGNNAMGTPAYMAPELFNGEVAVPASDQYSLGILAFEMLTGHLPFPQASFMQLMGAHCMKPPPPLPDAPAALQAIIMRMLQKKPEARYPSLHAVLTDLSEVPTG